MASRIELSLDQLRQIEDLARAAYPHEACGLLVGRVTGDGDAVLVTRIAESRNLAAPERPDRFEIDPALQFSLMRDLRGTGEAIVGVYHSHPNGRPQPSPRDLADARDPDLVWVITGLTAQSAAETRAFRLAPDGSRFEEIGLAAAASG
jgi:proteasome lid subunit RPN8/RPN11